MSDNSQAFRPDQIPEKWGDIASVYGHAFEKLTSQFTDGVISQLSPKTGESVLDVAAGTGSFSLVQSCRCQTGCR